MNKKTTLLKITCSGVFFVSLFVFTGCKAQKQMQQQIADLETKVSDHERRIATMDTDIKKTALELAQMKPLVTKLGNVVVDLQKAEEDRQKAAAEAKAKAAAAASTKKAHHSRSSGKKRH